MPAERAPVPSSSGTPTHKRRDIPLDAANSAGRGGLRLVLILVASFMVVLDFTIVNIALPSIEHDFGLRTSVVQWVVTGYAIAFSGLLILGGRAADLLGRRRTFMAGLVVFSLASLAGYIPVYLNVHVACLDDRYWRRVASHRESDVASGATSAPATILSAVPEESLRPACEGT